MAIDYVGSMKHEAVSAPPPPREPSAEDYRRAKESYAADGGVEHAVVAQWLRTWGQPGRKDFADWLNDQNG